MDHSAKQQEIVVKGGEISEYRVTMKLSFMLNDKLPIVTLKTGTKKWQVNLNVIQIRLENTGFD